MSGQRYPTEFKDEDVKFTSTLNLVESSFVFRQSPDQNWALFDFSMNKPKYAHLIVTEFLFLSTDPSDSHFLA